MYQRPNYGDVRQTQFCSLCGGKTESRDHVPPKFFLDKPYPENLPVIYTCDVCNHGASKDEVYVASVIECIKSESADTKLLQREKIRKAMNYSSKLASKISQARVELSGGRVDFEIEEKRLENIIVKLAKGHVAFELNSPQLDAPSNVFFTPIKNMKTKMLDDYEKPVYLNVSPEIGSRATRHIHFDEFGSPYIPWTIVQSGRYRYIATVNDSILVRFVISEYLACEVIWNSI